MRDRAAAELQVDVRAWLTKPDGALGSTQLDESELHLQHFDHGLEIARIEAIGDVIENHGDPPL
jgi:hypothetical protein